MFRRVMVWAMCVFSMFALPRLSLVQAWDSWVLQWMAAHRSSGLSHAFSILTRAGGTPGFLIAWIIPPILFLKQKRRREALIYSVGVLLFKASIPFLKIMANRLRPGSPLLEEKTLSMPSGHAFDAVVILVVALAILRKWGPSAKALRIPEILSALFALGVCLSRIYFGVHYPTDVLLGALYGACSLWLLQGFSPNLYSF